MGSPRPVCARTAALGHRGDGFRANGPDGAHPLPPRCPRLHGLAAVHLVRSAESEPAMESRPAAYCARRLWRVLRRRSQYGGHGTELHPARRVGQQQELPERHVLPLPAGHQERNAESGGDLAAAGRLHHLHLGPRIQGRGREQGEGPLAVARHHRLAGSGRRQPGWHQHVSAVLRGEWGNHLGRERRGRGGLHPAVRG